MNSELLLCVSLHHLSTYLTNGYQPEDYGRLQSQFRVFPSTGVPSKYYGCTSIGTLLCSRDLIGYHECTRTGLSPTRKCPAGSRCGCHLDGPCHLDRAEVCVPVKHPLPMPDKATFYFHGYTTKNFLSLYPRDNKERKPLRGVIKQDTKAGKFLQVISNDYYPYKTFELIVRDRDGTYVKYMGREGKCSNTTIPTFKPFGYDIADFHSESTTKLTDERTLQTWSFKAGYHGTIWVTWSWRWTIMADTSKNISIPVKSFYYESGAGPLYKQYVFWDVSTLDAPIKEENGWYGNGVNNSTDWFEVPEVCK